MRLKKNSSTVMCMGRVGTTTEKPLDKLLRSTSCAAAVLGILIYDQVNSGSCAPAARNLSSLATLLQRFPTAQRRRAEYYPGPSGLPYRFLRTRRRCSPASVLDVPAALRSARRSTTPV